MKINFCNDNEQKLFMAVAYLGESSSAITSRGWWAIEPKDCIDLEVPVSGDQLFVYSNSIKKNLEWAGTKKLCVDTIGKFDFNNSEVMACKDENQEFRGFDELSLSQLQSSAVDGKLQHKFIPENASRLADLVRLCNDAAEDLYLSIGQTNSRRTALAAAGWFKVLAGECYETARVDDADELLLFASTADGSQRWKGDVALCTNAYDKFIHKEATTMTCQGINERLQLFKKINMTSGGDFEFRLKPSMSETVRSMAQFCNVSAQKVALAIGYDNPDFPRQFVTSGWYGVDAGQCSEPLVVDSENLYIYVEDKDDDVLISGDFGLCIDALSAFEFGDGRGMACNELTQEKRSFKNITIDAGEVKINIP